LLSKKTEFAVRFLSEMRVKMKNFILKGNICYSISKSEINTLSGYVVCKDGKCAGVFEKIPHEYKDYELRNLNDKLIIPGMVDLHIHAPQYAFRGMGMDYELLEWLSVQTFPEEVKYTVPQGGLFIWAELPEKTDALAVLQKCIARNVAYIPGTHFYADGTGKNTLRLNFSNESLERIENGMKIMAEVFKAEI
jgi:guanine deaminase